jgi:hypothetical protein
MKRIDPGAPTYSLDYLRHHPEISNESVPWHEHTQMHNAVQAPAAEPAAYAAPASQAGAQ